MDETKLDGYKKFLYLLLGVAGTAAASYFNDPSKLAVANQWIAIATNFVPVAVGSLGAIIQGAVDIFKVKGAAQVEATKEEAKVITSTPMFDNPEYGKFQAPQIVDGKFVDTGKPQLKPDTPNVVTQNLSVWEKMANTDEGAFQILIGNIGAFIDEEYKRWSTASLQDVESLKEFAKRYLGVSLTPADCEAISANKNLASVVHAEADKTIIASIYTAHKAGTLGKGVWEGCMARAMFYARKSVFNAVTTKLQSEDMDLVREGMKDMGLNDYTIRRAINAGGVWYVEIGGSPRPIDVASMSGYDPLTLLPY